MQKQERASRRKKKQVAKNISTPLLKEKMRKQFSDFFELVFEYFDYRFEIEPDEKKELFIESLREKYPEFFMIYLKWKKSDLDSFEKNIRRYRTKNK